MSDKYPGRPHADIELATSIVAGGALTTEAFLPAYSAHLGNDPFVSQEERFFPNPRSNVRDHEEAYKRFEERAENVFDKNGGQRLVVIGHSFGGLFAVKLGLRRPDLVAAAKSEAGLQEGYNAKAKTVSIQALSWVVGKTAEDGRHDSPHIREFHEELESDWSPDVSLDLHSALFDDCFPLPQGLNLRLPPGQRVGRRVVAPNLPGMMAYIRSKRGMPADVEILPTHFATEHLLLPRASGEIKHTLGLRAAVAAGLDPNADLVSAHPQVPDIQPAEPAEPLLAAA
jgi:hypothetical protein